VKAKRRSKEVRVITGSREEWLTKVVKGGIGRISRAGS
jgi:hypothetical protein